MPDDRPAIDYTQEQSPADELRSKDLSLQHTRPPTEVPGYQAQRFLGAGAYGEVWAGQDRNTGRKVAIKFYAHRRGVDWSLLSREVEKLVFLSTDRYVVQLLEVGWDADPPYYVMEYIENGSLDDLLRARGRFDLPDALEMFQEIAVGLVHAHGRGVLHCDLKPANILLDQDGKPRLADFGQSRLTHEQKPALGTLFYMAPEQADLQAVPDVRWDVYALGAIFYCLLMGRPPHRDDTSVSHIETASDLEDRLARYRQLIGSSDVPKDHRRLPGMDSRLAEILERCLEPDPEDRFANVQEVLDALAARTSARTRVKLMALGLIGPLLVLLVTGFFSWRGYQRAVSDTEEGYRKWAIENNEFAAKLAAEKVTGEFARYFTIVRDEANEPALLPELLSVLQSEELKQIIAGIQDPDETPEWKAKVAEKNGENLNDEEKAKLRDDIRSKLQQKFFAHPDQKRLNEYLDGRLRSYLEAAKYDLTGPKFASIFMLDRVGNQIAVVFDDPGTSSRSIGMNLSHRTYFTGEAEDRAEDSHSEISPATHVEKTQLSAIFKSTSQQKWKVAISTPLYRGEGKEEFLGVLVFTINVGDFAFFRSENDRPERFAVLVDGRPGATSGTILQHRLFNELAKEGMKVLPEDLVAMRMPAEILRKGGGEIYEDPLGKHRLGRERKYDHAWIAATQPVRAPTVPGAVNSPKNGANNQETGLHVLVQSNYNEVVAPVHELSGRLLRNIVWMLAVVVIAGIAVWVLGLRIFREPRAGKIAASPEESIPMHSRSTMQAGTMQPE